MKLRSPAVSAVIFALMATAVFAQGPRGGPGPNRRNASPNAASGTPPAPPTPAEIATRQTNALTRFLGLSAAQEASVLTILTNEQTQLQTFQTQYGPQLTNLRENLTNAIKAGQPASALQAIYAQISAIQNQMEAIRSAAAGQIYATVLSTDQQTKVGKGLGMLLGGGLGRVPGFGPGGAPGPGGRGFGRGPRGPAAPSTTN